MEFKVENRLITETSVTLSKAARELKPILFLEAIEKLIKETFGDEYFIFHKIREYDDKEDTCFNSHHVGCEFRVHRMENSGEDDIPYIINIDSMRLKNYSDFKDANIYSICVGGIYRAFPDSHWELSTSTGGHGLKSTILYLAFCLNKFFNHK